MRRELLRAWSEHAGATGVLVTVVHVEGSAYRRPGARMLILPDGRRFGTVSGGCLEGDVARKAAWWTAAGDPVVRVYDTSASEDVAWEFGLGCNGVIHLLLEPAGTPAAWKLREQLAVPAPQVIATVVAAAPDSPYRVGDHFYSSEQLPEEFAAGAALVQASERHRLLQLPHATVFLEYVAPAQRLVIFGAGHDAMPVVSAAQALGWEVTVVDPRPGYATAARFSGCRVATDASAARIDGRTAVVMMTHNFLLDAKLLPGVLAKTPRYLGVLGPWSRMERLLDETGCGSLAGVHAPVGLDLGGDAPESVALSIVAEIEAVLHGRKGGRLRDVRRAAIHDPSLVIASAAQPVGAEDRTELTHCALYES